MCPWTSISFMTPSSKFLDLLPPIPLPPRAKTGRSAYVSVGLLGSREQGNLRKCSPSALESAFRNRGALGSAPESALEGALSLHRTTGRAPSRALSPESTPISESTLELGCRKWGCNKWGLKGCLAALPGNRPKSAKIALFLPFSSFSRGCEGHLGNPENGGKRPFSSDILRFA